MARAGVESEQDEAREVSIDAEVMAQAGGMVPAERSGEQAGGLRSCEVALPRLALRRKANWDVLGEQPIAPCPSEGGAQHG